MAAGWRRWSRICPRTSATRSVRACSKNRPYREIATELQCSELVIRKRVSRGLARMRDQLKETGST